MDVIRRDESASSAHQTAKTQNYTKKYLGALSGHFLGTQNPFPSRQASGKNCETELRNEFPKFLNGNYTMSFFSISPQGPFHKKTLIKHCISIQFIVLTFTCIICVQSQQRMYTYISGHNRNIASVRYCHVQQYICPGYIY